MNDLDSGTIYLKGGDTGILLIHGFTATPTEMSLLSRYLHDNGLTVFAPLLPGHGTTPAECNRYRWQHWANYVTVALTQLQDQCPTVFVGGLSMGSLLALYLAAKMPAIKGVAAYAPAFKTRNRLHVFTPVVKSFRHSITKKEGSNDDPDIAALRQAYDVYPTNAANELLKLQREVRGLLPRVKQPLLIVYSEVDPRVRSEGVDLLIRKARSKEQQVVKLQESGHIITLDKEWPLLAEKTLAFIEKYS